MVTPSEAADMTQAIPEFVIMNDDKNLLDGTNCKVTVNGVLQTSGVSTVDLSKGSVIYDIEYRMLGTDNELLIQRSQMYVRIAK